jgi:hypothetical protein
MKVIGGVLGSMVSSLIALAQLPAPNGDMNWNSAAPCLYDEFQTFNSSLWVKLTTPGYQWGQEVFLPGLVQVNASGGPTSSGVLNLVMQKVVVNGTFVYYSGGITSGNHSSQPPSGFNYPFGYYEISARLPFGKGLWPAFWIFGADPYGLPCPSGGPQGDIRRLEEIDIMENPDMGGPSSQPNWGDGDDYIGYNWHYQRPYAPCSIYHKSGDDLGGLFPEEIELANANLSTTYNKFAVEWLPGIMVFYFNGEPIVEALYLDVIPQDNRKEIFLTHQVGTGNSAYCPDCDGKVTPPTAAFSIDYIRVLELHDEPVNIVDVIIPNQSALLSYNYCLRRNIVVGSGPIVIQSGQRVALRATEGIVLDGNFEVAVGASFTGMVHDAPPPRGPAW